MQSDFFRWVSRSRIGAALLDHIGEAAIEEMQRTVKAGDRQYEALQAKGKIFEVVDLFEKSRRPAIMKLLDLLLTVLTNDAMNDVKAFEHPIFGRTHAAYDKKSIKPMKRARTRLE